MGKRVLEDKQNFSNETLEGPKHPVKLTGALVCDCGHVMVVRESGEGTRLICMNPHCGYYQVQYEAPIIQLKRAS